MQGREQNNVQPRQRYRIHEENPMYDYGEGDNTTEQLGYDSSGQLHNGYMSNRASEDSMTRDGVQGDAGLHMEYDHDMEYLLQQLPSRQLEHVADMASRTLRSARATTIRRPLKISKNDNVDDEIIEALQHDMDEYDGLRGDLDETVRTIPTTLSRKRNIKRKLSEKKRKGLRRTKILKYRLGMMWQNFKFEMRNAHHLFDLWRSHLLTIEGCFGSSVVSFFIFLKWVLLINIPIFLLTFSFLVIPQILYRYYLKEPSGYADASEDFTGIELLTGAGFFENSEMYYGFYTNETVEIISGSVYEMKYAYLFTCGGYYLFCLIILGYSFSFSNDEFNNSSLVLTDFQGGSCFKFNYLRSYRKYYIEAGGSLSQYYFSLVVCGWSYGITSPETSQLKHHSLYNEFKEYLSGIKSKKTPVTRKEVLTKWAIRLLTWTIFLMLLGGSGWTTYVLSTELSIDTQLANKTSIPVVSPLAMPVVISTIQLIIPMVFTLLESYERYSMPKYELYVHMFREMALNAALIGVLVYFWLHIVPGKLECWETFVGEEIYRLTVMDFIFSMGYTFFMEFVRKLLSRKWKSIERGEFAIGRSTLNLIYSQTLCWLGIFYSPLLPVVVILKLIIYFYVKKTSVIQNCRPSLKPWRASRTHTIYVLYLFLFFILSCVAVGYSIFFIEPSKSCGPYQNYGTTYEVITKLIEKIEDENKDTVWIFELLNSPGFIYIVLILLCMILYFMRILMMSHQEMVKQYKLQLKMEGRDKRFLMDLLNQVKVKGQKKANMTAPVLQSTMASMAADENRKGKVFVRTVAESMLVNQMPRV